MPFARWLPLVVLTSGLAVSACGPPGPRNIILLAWDSTRADHLSVYGYQRPTSPNLEAFARRAVVFEQAYSHHNWTRPAFHTVMTGRLNWQLPGGKMRDEDLVPLAERLQAAGYRTLGLVQNPNLAAKLGFRRGFDVYDRLPHGKRPAWMVDRVIERLAEEPAAGPFFLFVHLQGPHWPYPTDGEHVERFLRPDSVPTPMGEIVEAMREHREIWPEKDPGRVRYMIDLYDAAIHETDRAFGRLVTYLEEGGWMDDALVLFFSDHGDAFADRETYGHALYNLHPELTHIPLIARFPDRAGGRLPARVDDLVTHSDVFATALAFAGLPVPEHVAGRDLRDPQARDGRLAVSNFRSLFAVRSERWALHVDGRNGQVVSFYDRGADPTEVVAAVPERGAEYQRMLRAASGYYRDFLEAGGDDGDDLPPPDSRLAAELRALGYIE